MAKILITGGAGDIGYYLAKMRAELGDAIVIAENFSRGKRDEYFSNLLKKSNVSLMEGDLCDPDFVNEIPDDMDIVFHLAAINGTDNFYEIPFTVLENCTLPTINLLHHFRNNKNLRRFVYAGSSEAYASTVSRFGWAIPTDENVPLCIEDPTNIRWSYGASKLHGEIACFAAAAQFGIPVTIVRFHNVYGPRMGDKHVIPDFIRRARKGVYELKGYENTRSFIYVTDAVLACSVVAECPDTNNEIINIGGEREITMKALGYLILEKMNIKKDISCKSSPKGSVKRRVPDVKKLRELTDFASRVSLEKGLEMVIKELDH